MVLRIKNDLPCSLCSAPNCCHQFHKVFRSWGLQQVIKKKVALITSTPKKLTILGTLPITICRVISPAPLWAHWQELGGQPFPTNWLIDHHGCRKGRQGATGSFAFWGSLSRSAQHGRHALGLARNSRKSASEDNLWQRMCIWPATGIFLNSAHQVRSSKSALFPAFKL